MNRSIDMRIQAWAAATAVTSLFSAAALGDNGFQMFFTPLPKDDMQISLNAIGAYRRLIGGEMPLAISMVAGKDNATLCDDPWEEGVENPVLAVLAGSGPRGSAQQNVYTRAA